MLGKERNINLDLRSLGFGAGAVVLGAMFFRALPSQFRIYFVPYLIIVGILAIIFAFMKKKPGAPSREDLNDRITESLLRAKQQMDNEPAISHSQTYTNLISSILEQFPECAAKIHDQEFTYPAFNHFLRALEEELRGQDNSNPLVSRAFAFFETMANSAENDVKELVLTELVPFLVHSIFLRRLVDSSVAPKLSRMIEDGLNQIRPMRQVFMGKSPNNPLKPTPPTGGAA